MKAVVLEKNETLVFKEVPLPKLEPGMIRIRVAVCGICGSDIPRVFANGARKYPLILGHEFSGVIDAIGPDVAGLAIGDHAVAAPLIPCGKCRECKDGAYSLCDHYSFIGSRQDGAMAEYVIVPAQNVLRISEKLSFEQAATIEPATIALHGLRKAGYVKDRSVAVIGCGIIGLYALQWAKLQGAKTVTAVGRRERGLTAALKLGADQSEKMGGVMKRAETYDRVIECCGAPQTIRLAWNIVSKKGTVCLIGTPKKKVVFSPTLWEKINRKECSVTGSWMSYSSPFPGEEWTETIRRMETGELRLIPEMVRGLYPLEEASTAFSVAQNGNGRCLVYNTALVQKRDDFLG